MNRPVTLLRAALAAALMLGVLAAAAYAADTGRPDYFYKDIVELGFVKQYAVMPKPQGVMLIDSRPYETKHVQGYIPTSVSLPDSKFDELAPKLLPADKNTLLIFYCEGPSCKLSHNSARKAEKLGYTNVKVFAEGFPAWKAAGLYYSIGLERLHEMLAKAEPYLLIDSRPTKLFLEGAIPSAISIPDSEWMNRVGYLPLATNSTLVYYCQGYDCKLSHASAKKAVSAGYENVLVAEAGYPGWKEKYGASGGAVAMKEGGVEGAVDIPAFEKALKENPKSLYVVDVRDPDEFAAGHFPGAVNVPVGSLEKRLGELPADKTVVYTCSTGARSGEAFYMTQEKRPDLKQVFYIEGVVKYNPDGSYTITPSK